MNDEITEILDILQKCKDYDDEVYLIKQHGATLLLDYITNLQEENDNLINLVKEFENKGYDIGQERADFLLEIKDLQEEIKGYKQEREKLFETIHELQKSYEKLERMKKDDKK